MPLTVRVLCSTVLATGLGSAAAGAFVCTRPRISRRISTVEEEVIKHWASR